MMQWPSKIRRSTVYQVLTERETLPAAMRSVGSTVAPWTLSLDWLWLALIGLVEWSLVRRQITGLAGYDESYFVWEGYAIEQGLVPYRDFVEFKPPMMFLVNALGLKLFGLDYHHYRWIFVILAWLGTAGMFVSLRRRKVDRFLAFLVVVLMEFALLTSGFQDSSLNDSETTGMSFLRLGLASLLWTGPGYRFGQALGGAFLSMAVLSKEPYAVPGLAIWLTFGFIARSEQGIPWRRYAAQTCAGAAAVAVPILIWLLATRAIFYYPPIMRQYFHYIHRFGCMQAQSATELVKLASPTIGDNLLAKGVFLAALPLGLAFALLPTWSIAVRVTALLALLGGFYAVTIGGCYFPHYFTMGMSGLFLWMALGTVALSRFLRRSRSLALWIRGTLLALAIVEVGPRLKAEAMASYSSERIDRMGLPEQVQDFVEKNTLRGDYVFADGTPSIYFLTGRLPALRWSYFLDELIDFYPGATDVEKVAPMRAQLVERRPKIIYLDLGHVSRKQRTRRALVLPFVNENQYREAMPDLYVLP